MQEGTTLMEKVERKNRLYAGSIITNRVDNPVVSTGSTTPFSMTSGVPPIMQYVQEVGISRQKDILLDTPEQSGPRVGAPGTTKQQKKKRKPRKKRTKTYGKK